MQCIERGTCVAAHFKDGACPMVERPVANTWQMPYLGQWIAPGRKRASLESPGLDVPANLYSGLQ